MIVKTYCARMDHGGCGILAHVENGEITKIEGDPDSPLSRGTICAKGLAQIERLNHPDRLIYPMKRYRSKTFPISPLALRENLFFHTFSVMGEEG